METAQKSVKLYTPEQRARRDESVWTIVQAILAPLQFVVFIFSAAAVAYYLATDAGYMWAAWSVVAKTMVLYLIMITGAVWEKIVFGQYLFAPAFFWEDVFSFAVIGLHSLYIYGMFFADFGRQDLMLVAIIAYVAYVINAGQFLWKLRMARLEGAGA
ncbi:MAG: 2-vinyl bacteriochlorophyllide hydratase [SAR116 cluster bacterium]|nr:2-vinyl bacteriochlorophyllide hydratase [Paracoccaceae bacterium]RCL80783.1 MAG: 2-vinyl bacteriochlorophyllide hydratase [SAR116 cluster bacterium]